MKKLILSLFILGSISFYTSGISPYYYLGTSTTSIDMLAETVKSALEKSGFEILGEYHPGNDQDLYVIVFSNSDLINSSIRVKDRGLLAGAFKVGFVKEGSEVKLSMTNPDYIFHAYFRNAMNNSTLRPNLDKLSERAKNTLKSINGELKPFGGSQDEDDLQSYHYMMGMPYFTDPVKLAKFTSFEEGLAIIRFNLERQKGNTKKVYEIVNMDKKIAVFGVGLMDSGTGEAHFLEIIGKDHVAAMPYEIILMDEDLSMLHGRYRFALYWPELTMRTFTKIMSTPGDVEESMKGLSIK